MATSKGAFSLRSSLDAGSRLLGGILSGVLVFGLGGCALTPVARDRYESSATELEFAGRSWQVREGPNPGGAGWNHWSAGAEAAWVDENGLHLRIFHDGQGWRCAEVRTPIPEGAARIEWTVALPWGTQDPNIVLGLFVYGDDQHELDVEYAQWGDASADGFQFARSHAGGPDTSRFSLSGDNITASISWKRARAFWWATDGTETRVWSQRVGARFLRGLRNVHTNFWLFGNFPSFGEEREVLISTIQFYDAAGNKLPSD